MLDPKRDQLCECGCGLLAPIADRTSTALGWIKGQPHRFVKGHNQRKHQEDFPLGPNPSGLCQCGCGKTTSIAKKTDAKRHHIQGRAMRYVAGHRHQQRNGGGIWITKRGRAMVEGRDGSKSIFARVVMENEIGRALTSEEVVHHKDENPLNNHPDNLQLFSNQSEHMKVAHA